VASSQGRADSPSSGERPISTASLVSAVKCSVVDDRERYHKALIPSQELPALSLSGTAICEALSKNTFPTADMLKDSNLFNDYEALLPAVLLPVPTASHRGHRQRSRTAWKSGIIADANRIFVALNSLNDGFAERTPSRRNRSSTSCPPSTTPATRRLHAMVQHLAAVAAVARRAHVVRDILTTQNGKSKRAHNRCIRPLGGTPTAPGPTHVARRPGPHQSSLP
jgi:hypothetical protein